LLSTTTANFPFRNTKTKITSVNTSNN